MALDRAVITDQVANGVAVRMALLYLLSGVHAEVPADGGHAEERHGEEKPADGRHADGA